MKNSKNSKPLLLCILVAIFVVPATMAFTYAEPQSQAGPTGRLVAVHGDVKVNGTSAISGATVFSDSTATTAKGSSAVVSLGKLGRVEVFPDTTVKLTFSASTIAATLEAGRVRVSSSSGVTTTVTTSDGQVVTTESRMNEFTVDVTCGNTFVSVKKGSVELRAGTTVKQIAAGGQDTAGTARPGCTPGSGHD
jgi:ferric-dicitrate binding protein FerR (iron transport regulator)